MVSVLFINFLFGTCISVYVLKLYTSVCFYISHDNHMPKPVVKSFRKFLKEALAKQSEMVGSTVICTKTKIVFFAADPFTFEWTFWFRLGLVQVGKFDFSEIVI